MKLPRSLIDAPCAFESLDRVPEKKRLRQYSSEFNSRDVWNEFHTDQIRGCGYSQSHKSTIEHCEVVWKDHCQGHGRHHALTTPEIVQSWCHDLINERTQETAQQYYLNFVNRFYIYLMWSDNYPHMYNPVQFAISDYPIVAEIWESGPHGDKE